MDCTWGSKRKIYHSVVYIGRWLEKQSRKILLGIVIIGENGVLKHLIINLLILSLNNSLYLQ